MFHAREETGVSLPQSLVSGSSCLKTILPSAEEVVMPTSLADSWQIWPFSSSPDLLNTKLPSGP